FHVRTICSSTSSSNWVTLPFTTPVSCVAPSAPAISNISMTGADANWGAVTGSAGYEWAVTTTSSPPASGANTTATSQTLSSLTSGTQYYFHVRNKCSSTLF